MLSALSRSLTPRMMDIEHHEARRRLGEGVGKLVTDPEPHHRALAVCRRLVAPEVSCTLTGLAYVPQKNLRTADFRLGQN